MQRYRFLDYDQTIAKNNQSTEQKEYPFSKVDVHVRIDSIDYVFHIEKNSDGQLYVLGSQ